MKTKLLSIALLLILLYNTCYSQQVEKKEAKIVAQNFLSERIDRNFKIIFDTLVSKNNKSVFYFFNIEEKGWIIVSGNKNVVPVIAYSYSGHYNHDEQPPAFLSLLNDYKSEILFDTILPKYYKNKNNNKWKYYLSNSPDKNINNINELGPLLKVAWGQTCYYNDSTPYDAGGSCNHCVTGCVATAMAQILQYHNYPSQGIGSHCYNHILYGDLCANFGNTTYNWPNMEILYLEDTNSSIAQLMYHCGISVDMNYGANSSGAYLVKVRPSFIDYFNYYDGLNWKYRVYYSNSQWNNMLKNELENDRPVYYVGWKSNNDSHAFIIDGYQGEYFHINYGWGPWSLRYSYLDSLTYSNHPYALFDLQPQIHFTANQSSSCIPDTVNFLNLSTVDATSWFWEFGNGTTSTEESPTQIYTEPGIYSVTLTAINNNDTISRTRRDYINVKLVNYEKITTNIEYLENAKFDWGDYDNDEDLDLIICGYNFDDTANYFHTYIYRNDGNDVFTNIDEQIIGAVGGAVKWGDMDNDGDLDFIITGGTSFSSITYNDPITKLYENQGNDNFIFKANPFAEFFLSDLDWADFNNDGLLDIIIIGESWNQKCTKIYKNIGNGNFIEVETNLYDVKYGSVALADYDKDGYIDIAYCGVAFNNNNPYTFLFKNIGNFQFEEQSISMQGVYEGSLCWGDYDNDNDLDLLVTGEIEAYPNETYKTKIYKNDNGNFSEISTEIEDMGLSSACWGDYDNDGMLDFIISGRKYHLGQKITKCYIYHNEGNDQFVCYNNDIEGLCWYETKFIDYNNDGNLDIFSCGQWQYNNFHYWSINLYKNISEINNIKPSSPNNLTCEFLNYNNIKIIWSKGNDDITPKDGLNYNIFCGTTPYEQNIMPGLSNLENGYRLKSQIGNTSQDTFWIINDLEEGETYYWSVQSIDGAYQGSEFAEANTFTTGYLKNQEENTGNKSILIYPNPCDNIINLVFKNYEFTVNITIFNSQGKIIYHDIIPIADLIYKKIINCRQWENGVYHLRVRDNNSIIAKRFIICN